MKSCVLQLALQRIRKGGGGEREKRKMIKESVVSTRVRMSVWYTLQRLKD